MLMILAFRVHSMRYLYKLIYFKLTFLLNRQKTTIRDSQINVYRGKAFNRTTVECKLF